jgi:hypothetical protein
VTAGADALVRALASPEAYPHKLDDARTKVALIRLTEAEYHAASFLDDRILTPATKGGSAPLEQVAEAVRALTDPKPLHFIFHIGHVGSTLLSRLLGEIPGVLSLREPLPLRQLADKLDDAILDTFIRLWKRGFSSTQAVVLKATSSAARIAPRLMTAVPDARAVYMHLDAEPYLATLLAGENSPQDLAAHQAERNARLASHLGETPRVDGIGELAAMSWLTERLTMQAVVAAHGARVMPLDFDALLTNVDHVIAAVTRHLRWNLDPRLLLDLKNSPVFARYSKAPEHEYSPALREQVLAQSRSGNAAEIARGIAWLDALAQRHTTVGKFLG